MTKEDRPKAEINGVKYTLGPELSAPGDWWDQHQPIRRCEPRDESHFVGMVLETPKGWFFVERKCSLDSSQKMKAPPRSGPFKQWEDVVMSMGEVKK